MANLPDFALPAGVAGAIALFLATLVKSYYSNRNSIQKQQSEHIIRLTAERNETVVERDKLYDQLEQARRDKSLSDERAQSASLLAARQVATVSDLNAVIAEKNARISLLEARIVSLGGSV